MGLVFWEKQGADRMCGLHCLNALLQGPYFDESDLSDVALKLDALEQSLLSKEGTVELVKRNSHNVSADGFFSVSVIEQCLKDYGIWLVPINKPAVANSVLEPSKEEAFLCHLHDHWLAIRKVGEEWYNLDSLKPAPTVVSEFHLSAFLQGMQHEGFSIFVIRPDVNLHTLRGTGELSLPQPAGFLRISLPPPRHYLGQNQYRLTKSDIEQMWKIQKGKDKAQDEDVWREHGGDSNTDKDSSEFMNRGTVLVPAKHEWPTSSGHRLDGGTAVVSNEVSTTTALSTTNTSEEDEIQNAMKLSMMAFIENLPRPADEPGLNDARTTTIQLRLPDGSRHARRFSNEHKLQEIVRWLEGTASVDTTTGQSRFSPPLALTEAYSIITGLGVLPKTCISRVSGSIQVVSDGAAFNGDELVVGDLNFDSLVNFHFRLIV
eukprot:Lankesteria_metandrocarpae@DN596_c0_g1_i1.p1